jgi:UDP-N-acetylmuramoyl-tripeptide--D-alanyl-D-alanine ligase
MNTAGDTRTGQGASGYRADRLAAALGGRLVRGTGAENPLGVSTDSRSLQGGELFFALPGANVDGHDFVETALSAGAAGAVVSRVDPDWSVPPGRALIVVADTELALRDAAAFHRDRLGARTVAVTGSCGKSTTKSILGALLAGRGPTTAAPASFNNRIGVSLTILSARPDDAFLVLELGANHGGEIDELARLGRPDVGVITTIGEAHLEGFGSLDGVMRAKGEIARHIAPGGTLVVNGDNARCRKIAQGFPGRVLRFGFGRGLDLRAERIEGGPDGTRFTVRGRRLSLPLAGRFNVLNALAALAACEGLGLDWAELAAALGEVSLPGLRSRFTRVGDVVLIEDCYNANPTAMRAALELMASSAGPGRRIAVCGEMRELGPAAARLHRRVGREIAAAGVEALFTVGALGGETVEGFRRARPGARWATFESDEIEALTAALLAEIVPGSCVLVKGSRALRMERVLDSVKAELGRSAERPAA